MAREFLQNQLIKLGDMMGDGLHHEPDGKWITREYRKIFLALHPDIAKEQRQQKNKETNQKMKVLLEKFKCTECNGSLRQSRSGSKIAYCNDCNTRFRVKTRKN